MELSPEAREAISGTALEEAVESGQVDPATLEALVGAGDDGDTVTPVSLPGGETRDTVASSAISMPDAEGSVEGMGESFSPVLSSGTGTFSVPIAVAPGRAGVQPSLSLAYSSAGGNSSVGFGWGLGVPYISRQTDRGLPLYDDRALWHPNEDRFIYNGGQELVPVDANAVAAIEDSAAGGGDPSLMPSDLMGWQQYRARVEGGFMRFFRGPTETGGAIRRWVVQSPDGTRFDFGALSTGAPDADSGSSLETDDETGNRVFRWMLTRMSDAHGSTIYYHYRRDRGQLYLDSIYYLSPAACGASLSVSERRECTELVASYGARVRLIYEAREDAFTTYTSGYPITTALRLKRVEVTSRELGASSRSLVRRYHLRYRTDSFHTLLDAVQVEGRPSVDAGGWEEGVLGLSESSLNDTVVGSLLPPMRFTYSTLPTGSGTSPAIPGFGSLSNRIVEVRNSPLNSIDEARTELFDVNSDGLLDVIVTDPARYRTPSGAPAVGVFFNGFSGADARPAPRTSGVGPSFSDAVPLPMQSGLSGTLNLGNLNVVPMDMDGDGRGDLLHMPRLSTYGWFTPTRAADPDDAAARISPASQGWRWSYAEVDLPSGDLDPRIDLGRDGARIQTLDVNGDHLVDVLRTTGTVMQTWLNLGWLPGGDGRFGSYTRSDSGSVSLSTLPYESCLLQSSLPIDFEDPEVRFADMNADGIEDIVRVRRGRVQYWPGRGLGSWGTGTRSCPRGEGDLRYVEMASSPVDLDIDLAGVQLADVDGDGASDLVQIGFDRISVWFNRAGSSWTERTIVSGTPAAPSFASRTRLVDIDGSGTLDVLYGDGRSYRYVDLLGGTTPRMLVNVDNGLGALTTMTYASASEDYLRDLDAARTCGSGCESFAWGRVTGSASNRLRALSNDPDSSLFRANGTPVLSTVVRSVSTTDRFNVFGREAQVTETRFAYHDGYYEGIEQEFRGFGAADSVTIGDDDGPSVLTRTWFHQGRRAESIADDRLAWNPDEALKGREYLTEVFDEAGLFLSTSHASLTTRLLYTGLDGRPVQYAFVHESNEIRYDTTPFTPLGTGLELPSVVRETVNPTTGAVTGGAADPPRTIAVRGARAVRIRATWDSVDNLGHVLQQTAHGRAEVPGSITGTDDHIISHTTPRLLAGSEWLWRTASSYVTGTGPFDGGITYGNTTNTYNAVGDLTSSSTGVSLPTSFTFAGDAHGAQGFTQTAESIVASSVLDNWGQPLASCAGDVIATAPSTAPSGCLRYSRVIRETDFDQLVIDEIAHTGTSTTLTVHATWDRGLGVLVTMTDPNDLTTEVAYDGLGRMTALIPPAATGCSEGVPTTRIRYELTANPSSQPLSRVITTTELDCDGTLGDEGTPIAGSTGVEGGALTAIRYLDGLGRVRVGLATGPDSAGSRRWLRSGVSRYSRKGNLVQAFQPDYYSGGELDFVRLLEARDATPSTRAVCDAFGRSRYSVSEDGALSVISYHALSTDVCDPLDNDPSSPHVGTCTTARTDGHGRLIDQILRNRPIDNPFAGMERHRLWTYYRADGSVRWLVRSQTSDENPRPDLATALGSSDPHVSREFIYDSVARRIASNDPDTDDPDGAASSRTWRYLFNRVGDLVAVRDPRGCGQNFYYDVGGRLLGEDYVSCGEAQSSTAESPAYDIPAGAIALGPTANPVDVDVRYFYDDYPDWVGSGIDPPMGSAGVLGRATGVADRGQRSAVAYDNRGNAIWTARQMAVISAPLTLTASALTDGRPTFTESAPSVGTVVYDDSVEHTYLRTASFDHAARPTAMTLPVDPDWDPLGVDPSPEISGALEYDRRGLPARALLTVGALDPIPVVAAIEYLRDGLVSHIEYGDLGSAPVIESHTEYDVRRRPVRMTTTREPTAGALEGELGEVSVVHDQRLEWDTASNLTALVDERLPSEWPDGFRPQTVEITHDSLYRVVGALFHYSTDLGDDEDDDASDWRTNAAASNAVDPMRPEPAAMVGSPSGGNRVRSLVWEWDWLGNMTEWTDDAQQFYERSIGDITNGHDLGASARPSALYVSTNLDVVTDGTGGWVEVDYDPERGGSGGNVTSLTVHGECSAGVNPDVRSTGTAQVLSLANDWICGTEQHFEYRWDELNRIVEARRWDRSGTGDWSFEARQRYRYDGANQRTVKESFDTSLGDSRVALYVYPGDFERRGLTRGSLEYESATTGYETETQYLIAGARLVWDHTPISSPGDLDRNRRLTIGVTDLVQATVATVDLLSGELLEVSTYYPNGARETLRTNVGAAVPLEPMGFTGKEADEDVGLVYFGERYLLARAGRWASPDPLHVHASGGGEALNSYHYASGALGAGRDPIGLQLALHTDDPGTVSDRGRVLMHAPPVVGRSMGLILIGGAIGVACSTSLGLVCAGLTIVSMSGDPTPAHPRREMSPQEAADAYYLTLGMLAGGAVRTEPTVPPVPSPPSEPIVRTAPGGAGEAAAVAPRVEPPATSGGSTSPPGTLERARPGCSGPSCGEGACFVAGTRVALAHESVLIDRVALGSEVPPVGPDASLCAQAIWPENPIVFELKVVAGGMGTVLVELVRGADSINVAVGEVVPWVALDDIGYHGPAQLTGRAQAPSLASGVCRVTGRYWSTSHRLVEIVSEEGHATVATAGHRFYNTATREWVRASTLRAGDHLATRRGEVLVRTASSLGETAVVYNLEVGGSHAYVAGPDWLLSHNQDGPCVRYEATRDDPGRIRRPEAGDEPPWTPGPRDEVWAGTPRASDWDGALEEAFARTGHSRDEFAVTEWGRTSLGKSVPVEYTGPRGAEVSVDYGHPSGSGAPEAPHVGWQTSRHAGAGGTTERGHIVLGVDPPAAR
jgi:RHS repeat-associated protein